MSPWKLPFSYVAHKIGNRFHGFDAVLPAKLAWLAKRLATSTASRSSEGMLGTYPGITRFLKDKGT